jgi:hypothetical protein
MEIKAPPPVDILTLGSGWIGTFLKKEFDSHKLIYASTSRDGSNDTIPFSFDPKSADSRPYARLPLAKTVIVIFPLVTAGAHEILIRLYNQTHPDESRQTRWIQLGSTSAFDVSFTLEFDSPIHGGCLHQQQPCRGRVLIKTNSPKSPGEDSASLPLWRDRHSSVDTSKARVMTEEELLALPNTSACVLNLAGLWGGSRDMRQYVGRVAPTKDALASKGSLHMIHGMDVARCLAAAHQRFAPGRWLLTDMRVYDWWDLVSAWGAREEGTATPKHADWVRELLVERGLRALPRTPEQMGGKALDSREFWDEYRCLNGPLRAGLGKE